jgi:hypothetical protein
MFGPMMSGCFVFDAARDYRPSRQDLLAPPLRFCSTEKRLLQFDGL